MRVPRQIRQPLAGIVVGALGAVLLTLAMLPLRSHLSAATTALVLVVPVVAGVASGGFPAGLVATACGFLAYDFVFIPPYYTFDVGAAQNWVALGVYAVVMVVVARVVGQLKVVRSAAVARAAEVRRLFDLSELLVRESSVPELVEPIVQAVVQAFGVSSAALLLPSGDRLQLMACAGEPIPERSLERLVATATGPVSMAPALVELGSTQVVALAASGRAIGLLVLTGLRADRRQLELLRAFANHLALALERGQLSEQALRAQLLEEVDRVRRSLVGAVSHDLRTPLATIKVSTSTLLDPQVRLSTEEARELVSLVDAQADRLDRLVANLLDMTRIQSGALELRPVRVEVCRLVGDAIAALGSAAESDRLSVELPAGLPAVEVDPVLVVQVLANLLDNAFRHAPERSPVMLAARDLGDAVELTVTDEGPGLSPGRRPAMFQMTGREAGGRGGLGLGIAAAFVEAHGSTLEIGAGPEGVGARVGFRLLAAPAPRSDAAATPGSPAAAPAGHRL